MSNGNNSPTIEELEANLNQVIEQLYTGLYDVAAITRAGGNSGDRLQLLADDICRHWPTCRAAHNLDPPEAPKH